MVWCYPTDKGHTPHHYYNPDDTPRVGLPALITFPDVTLTLEGHYPTHPAFTFPRAICLTFPTHAPHTVTARR